MNFLNPPVSVCCQILRNPPITPLSLQKNYWTISWKANLEVFVCVVVCWEMWPIRESSAHQGEGEGVGSNININNCSLQIQRETQRQIQRETRRQIQRKTQRQMQTQRQNTGGWNFNNNNFFCKHKHAHSLLLTISRESRVAQNVAAWEPGCKKMGREWENEEEMEREWGNGERLEICLL